MGDILNIATIRIVFQQIDRLDRDDFKILAGGRDPTPLIEKLYAEMELPTAPAKTTIGKIFTILTRRIQEQGVNPYAIFNGPVKWNEEENSAHFLSEEVTGSPSDYLQVLRLRLVRKYPEFNNIIVGGKSKRSKRSRSRSKSKKSKKIKKNKNKTR